MEFYNLSSKWLFLAVLIDKFIKNAKIQCEKFSMIRNKSYHIVLMVIEE